MKRLAENPLITPRDLKPSRPDFEVIGTFNAGVTRFRNELLLLLRVAERPRQTPADAMVSPVWSPEAHKVELVSVSRDDAQLQEQDPRWFYYQGSLRLTSISHLRLARSIDGVHFAIDDTPALFPSAPTETYGLEDPRITRIDDDYWITYKAVSEHGIATALAHTTDFRTFTRHGVIFSPENLDVVIFPETFDGAYAAWTRPVGKHIGLPSIWTARSPDLVHWGMHEPALCPRPGFWDSARVGASTVPFKTSEGWLEIYHGADENNLYCLGAVLIDGENPRKVLARSDRPLMRPQEDYEKRGFFPGVVFSCGADVREDGQVFIYYGAADECTCAATTTVDEIIDTLDKF